MAWWLMRSADVLVWSFALRVVGFAEMVVGGELFWNDGSMLDFSPTLTEGRPREIACIVSKTYTE